MPPLCDRLQEGYVFIVLAEANNNLGKQKRTRRSGQFTKGYLSGDTYLVNGRPHAFKPGVVKHFLRRGSLVWVHLQHRADERRCLSSILPLGTVTNGSRALMAGTVNTAKKLRQQNTTKMERLLRVDA